ncbi:hypothetical protein ACLMJK_001969 [Lecanora helva]
MCVRKNKKGGKAYRLGLRKNISIELVDEFPDALYLIDDPFRTNSSAMYDWFEVPASFLSPNVDTASLEAALPLKTLTASDAVEDSIMISTNLTLTNSSAVNQS